MDFPSGPWQQWDVLDDADSLRSLPFPSKAEFQDLSSPGFPALKDFLLPFFQLLPFRVPAWLVIPWMVPLERRSSTKSAGAICDFPLLDG